MELNKEKLLELYPDYTSVLGPYTRPDGRMHVVLNNSNAPKGQKGKTKTISYPKALVESNIEERLLPNETVDHDNRDFTDNSKENLKIRDRSEHSVHDATYVVVGPATCIECGTVFIPSVGQANSRAGKAGPFCSRKCSGKYGARVQNGGEVLERQEIDKTYYRP